MAPNFFSENINLCIPISTKELKNCIKHSDTAPGEDNISYSMIDNLPQAGKEILTQLYNKIFESGFVPEQWKNIKIIPIPKPGSDNTIAKNIRPIALLSCPCKIFHLIISRRLEWFFEANNLFSKDTIGFRRSKSTMDNLSRLINHIQCGFTKGSSTVGCFIDLESAYNNVDVPALLSILDSLGIGSKLCKYLWNFLNIRHLSIHLDNGDILRRTTGTGLAQGDPLSPLLFNAATFKICRKVKNYNTYVSQYADDFLLYTSNKVISQAMSDVQNALNIFGCMIDEIGLTISLRKTKTCVFSRGLRFNNGSIYVKNHAIEHANSVKYLGMLLDRNLKWNHHIDYLRNKTLKFLNIFKVLAGSKWGIHPKHLRRLYIAIIRSRLDYGSFLYDNSPQYHLIKLDKVQNQALRIIGGFIRTTPIHVMEAELGVQPLCIRRNYLAGKFWLRSRALSNNETINSLDNLNRIFDNSTYWRRKKTPLMIETHRTYKSYAIHTRPKLDIYSWNTWISSLDPSENIICSIEGVNTAKRYCNQMELNTHLRILINNKYQSYYQLFTDGSKDVNASGAAFFDLQSNLRVKFKTDSDFSVMHNELVAISECLSYALSLNSCRFVLFCDSKSALQHLARLSSSLRGYPIAFNILDLIGKLNAADKQVIFQWIPSHVGIMGNEAADLAAKQAMYEGIPYFGLPLYNEVLRYAKENCFKLWQEYFDERSLSKGIWYKTIQCQVPRCLWFELVDINRKYVVILFRLRSGHIPGNKFKYLMGKSESPNCSNCPKIEDVHHALIECVRSENERNDFFNNCSNVGTCNSILALPNSDKAIRMAKIYNSSRLDAE
ncbi:hypothetical protein O3G_MSEX012332 [Manduca sexta]|uniref:Pol-like protein n=1 Tax=Manduca sexta TaxID=7130 RepID=A0A921ZPF4_MANSE|nr:hypothetical protein O3G_MSEX012332 [Manduca sexta]